ncbi:isocitrate lyase/PEP mutase family protein [Streptomyces shenzhenensis]|uniref:isocitrate lyase/PEP mutase family protein n=1 Tax=Streptomyces shenzhenensis TaxID=943815 RepID=UPI003407FFFC
MSANPALKTLLTHRELAFCAGIWDPITALLAQQAGFNSLKLGSSQVGGAFGLPDVGLLSPHALTERIFEITSHCDVPVLVDFESGFGRTSSAVHWAGQFEKAGASGIHIDDYGDDKCPWVPPYLPKLDSAESVAHKIKSIAENRQSDDFVIVGRTGVTSSSAYTDAAEALEEGLRRARLWKEAGCDVIWVRAYSPEHLQRYRDEIDGTLCVQIASTTGGGRVGSGGRRDATQEHTAYDLHRMGFDLVMTGASLLPVALKAVADAAHDLHRTGDPNVLDGRSMPFAEWNSLIGLETALQQDTEMPPA